MEFFQAIGPDAGGIAILVSVVGMLIGVVRYLGKKSDAASAALVAVIEKQRDEFKVNNDRLTEQLRESEQSRISAREALLRATDENKKELLGHVDKLFGAVQVEVGSIRTELELLKQDVQRLKRRRGNNV